MRMSLRPLPSVKDSRSFDYFRRITLSGLIGFGHNSEFWNQTVLQFCEASPAVLHAVLGVSALHENLLKQDGVDPMLNGDLVFLKQYNKSIKFLQSGQESQSI
jgi:hypothetical protein